jgi:hypothetical protein
MRYSGTEESEFGRGEADVAPGPTYLRGNINALEEQPR